MPFRSLYTFPADVWNHTQEASKASVSTGHSTQQKREKGKKYESSQLILVRNVAGNFLQLFFALILFKHIRKDPLNKHLCTWKMFTVCFNQQATLEFFRQRTCNLTSTKSIFKVLHVSLPSSIFLWKITFNLKKKKIYAFNASV